MDNIQFDMQIILASISFVISFVFMVTYLLNKKNEEYFTFAFYALFVCLWLVLGGIREYYQKEVIQRFVLTAEIFFLFLLPIQFSRVVFSLVMPRNRFFASRKKIDVIHGIITLIVIVFSILSFVGSQYTLFSWLNNFSSAFATVDYVFSFVVFSFCSLYLYKLAKESSQIKNYSGGFILTPLIIPLAILVSILMRALHLPFVYETVIYAFSIHVQITGFWFIYKIMSSYQDLHRFRRSVSYFVDKMHEGNREMIQTLAAMLEMRDEYTAGHSERVRDFAFVIAWGINLSGEEKDTLNTACLLHDIGKIGVPESVLNKPGQLSPAEYNRIKQHSIFGREMLSCLEDFTPFLDIVYHHHERWDGLGYPSGLAATRIPLLSRVIAIADTFDALTSDRVYRKGVSFAKGCEILTSLKGTQLDAELVDVFVKKISMMYNLNLPPTVSKVSYVG